MAAGLPVRSLLQRTEYSVWPLVFPNWLTFGYKQVADKDIADDLIECRNNHINITVDNRPDCPLIFPHLVSYTDVLTQINQQLIDSIADKYNIKIGGRHEPHECRPRQRVAIIVPFRDRWTHLWLFVQHLHPFLVSQRIDYQIFIVEQTDSKPFNRGKLFNIGFREAMKMDSFCCLIFHDIDVLPIDRRQLYSCSHTPRHMCSALDKFRYVLIYPDLLGGVVAIRTDQYREANGYSNRFEGWGAEDDDFYNRIKARGLVLRRWSPQISRCLMLSHKPEKPNPDRKSLLASGSARFESDGLNDLDDSYQILAIHFEPLYTIIKAKLL
ncbi:unnamed protein product [Medioppia subpectinata]|uniref:Beta-1,4-N-acetylgalactosaminyltransferase n=1 Tax=Medioppia subpectinata TaxID=1979941 RepID=A0A7R9KNR8_9ACAR|nr:unnamed protein product [Medioppia subpectinata]CAG2106994.1 unnamed protein product [Medioppia subpectinata]